MRPTLLESDRSFLRSAECTFASLTAHAVVALAALGVMEGGSKLPTDEREARVFFLLPPDRVDSRPRQMETFQGGRLGRDLENGKNIELPDEGRLFREPSYGSRDRGKKSGAQPALPFGPVEPFTPDTAFSVLDVDEMVERHAESAAPVYPRDLLAIGAEGLVQTIYVVDTAGRVDTATVQVLRSDDPRFTASVVTALANMRFSPARRAGKSVRQLVEQQFRFRIMPAASATVAKEVS